MRATFETILKAALALGVLIDGGVGIVALVAQPLLQPLFDIPVKDAAVTMIAGGELVVAACVYAFAFRDLRRWQPLLWICALDQLFGAILPAIAIVHGDAPATFKTLAPIPLQLILVMVFVIGARRRLA